MRVIEAASNGMVSYLGSRTVGGRVINTNGKAELRGGLGHHFSELAPADNTDNLICDIYQSLTILT